MKKITTALKILFAYITLCGLVMFPCFILEESIQMATFGTWPAADAQDWELMLEGCNIIESANTTMKIINYFIGWIQPLAFLSYRSYAISTDYYITALKSKIFAHSPVTLDGQTVTTTINLRGARLMDSEEGYLYQLKAHKALFLYLQQKASSSLLRLTATIEVNDHGVFIHPN